MLEEGRLEADPKVGLLPVTMFLQGDRCLRAQLSPDSQDEENWGIFSPGTQ